MILGRTLFFTAIAGCSFFVGADMISDRSDFCPDIFSHLFSDQRSTPMAIAAALA
jgi:hypothetical protein